MEYFQDFLNELVWKRLLHRLESSLHIFQDQMRQRGYLILHATILLVSTMPKNKGIIGKIRSLTWLMSVGKVELNAFRIENLQLKACLFLVKKA